MGQNKPAPIDNPAESNSPIPKVVTTSTKGKGKLKLKKKTTDDPFVSDNDDHEGDKTSKNPTAELKRSNDDGDDEEAKFKKKRIN